MEFFYFFFCECGSVKNYFYTFILPSMPYCTCSYVLWRKQKYDTTVLLQYRDRLTEIVDKNIIILNP